MRKFMISALALVAASVQVANVQAADVVQTYDPPVAAPVSINPTFGWDGFYFGAQAGGAWTKTDTSLNANVAGVGAGSLGFSLKADGFVGGLYTGYNFALDNDVVLGLETDFVWGNVDKRYNMSFNIDPALDVVGYFGVKQKWAGATRLRAGFAMDRFLPYVAAGVAYAKAEGRLVAWGQDPATGAVIAGSEVSDKDHATFTGWTLGIGGDYAMTDNVLLRAEYRYSDYGDKTYSEDLGGGNSASIKFKHKAHDLRVGVAYKF